MKNGATVLRIPACKVEQTQRERDRDEREIDILHFVLTFNITFLFTMFIIFIIRTILIY